MIETNSVFSSANSDFALLTYARSIDFFKMIKNSDYISVCLTNMGILYLKSNDFLNATQKFEECVFFVQ